MTFLFANFKHLVSKLWSFHLLKKHKMNYENDILLVCELHLQII